MSRIESEFGSGGSETRERETDEAAAIVNQVWLVLVPDGGHSGSPQRCRAS